MIVTIKQAFVDEPKGRKARKYNYGDVVDMSATDYERISKQQPSYLEKGKLDLGAGTCEPCTKKEELQEKKASTQKVDNKKQTESNPSK